VTEPAGESRHWVAANANARLDRPVEGGERHRLAKRVAAGVCRPFLRRQTAYNLELLAELVTIRDSLVAQTKALGASTTDQFASLVTQVDVLASRVDELHVLLGVTNARLDEAMVDRDLVHQEVELARRQALDGIDEAVGGVRRELGLVARRVGGRENEPTGPGGRVPQT
jgi:hypothetical protein